MKVVCAWCGKVEGEKEHLNDLLVSHTICPECYKQQMKKYLDVKPGEMQQLIDGRRKFPSPKGENQ